jgi:transcriptional regulator with XRE-family HTH domain
MGGDDMPDIIDNVKVGEFIKKLLKKNNMTQDDLADSLSISKSAVSQNLRGKSSFDILNLVQIAKLFDITLDDLLNLKTEDNKEVISEYQKVVNQGLGSLKNVSSSDLRISEPDLYGKVLVDYIIEQRALDMLLYLIDESVLLVQDYYHRAKQIYLKIIKYLLEEDQENIGDFIMKYTELNGSFQIDDEQMSLIIWGLLNKPSNQKFLEELIQYKPSIKSIWFSKNSLKERLPLTKSDYIDMIAKYQLTNILKTFIKCHNRDDELLYVTNQFINYQYYEGLSIYINHFFKESIGWYKKTVLEVQKAILLVIKTNQYDLVVDFARKGLFTDMTQVVRHSILDNQIKIASHLIANYHEIINFKKVGEALVEMSNVKLLEDISIYLTGDDLNYLLSWVKLDDIKTMIFFIQKGAKIDEKYYNLETFKKVNQLIVHLLKKGENE